MQNSNLVLTAETRTREAAEPSGEPESLHGRMRGKMGDRVQHSKPEGYEERKQKATKKRQAQREFELEAPQQKRRVSQLLSSRLSCLVLSAPYDACDLHACRKSHAFRSCSCRLAVG